MVIFVLPGEGLLFIVVVALLTLSAVFCITQASLEKEKKSVSFSD